MHNYLRSKEILNPGNQRRYSPDNDDEDNGEWRSIVGVSSGLHSLPTCTNNNYTRVAKTMRDNLAHYFNNSGSVEWQYIRAGVENTGAL